MNAIFYPAIFHPEETGYSVEIPDIEGCFTQGDTMDEAVRMAQDLSLIHISPSLSERRTSGNAWRSCAPANLGYRRAKYLCS